MRGWVLGLVVLVSAVGSRTTAETYPPESVTVCATTELADAVVTGTFESADARDDPTVLARFQVNSVLAGELEAGARIVVIVPRGSIPTGGEPATCVLFLRRADSTSDERWRTVAGSLGVRPVRDSASKRFYEEGVRAFRGCELASVDGRREHLSLLVSRMAETDGAVAWDAAIDFARHSELQKGLTDPQIGAIRRAFDASPRDTKQKRALARALGATESPAVVGSLLDALADTDSVSMREEIGGALLRTGRAHAATGIRERLPGAEPPARCHLLSALGHVGGVEDIDTARTHVRDAACDVRIQAAHALGRIARHCREQRTADALPGTAELVAALETATDRNEKVACLWALAQLDHPDAVRALDRARTESPDPLVRRYAKRFRKQPRQSLILR